MPLNRQEAIQFLKSFFSGLNKTNTALPAAKTTLKPFLNFVLSLKTTLSASLLRDLAAVIKAGEIDSANKTDNAVRADKTAGIILRRIDRRYLRLCRVQEELGGLDFGKASFGKAASGTALEDFVFSQIDFSRYREMDEKYFNTFFPEGLSDFEDNFFRKNFSLTRAEIQSLIEGSYKKTKEFYRMEKDNPLILSIMRSLDTSLENSPLFSAEEILKEMKQLLEYIGSGAINGSALMPGMELLYPMVVASLDKVLVTHGDGMKTTLFISPQGDLSATFRPNNKPWTRVLIANEHLANYQTVNTQSFT